jgi:recombinational DNA repair protein (RecF pathway)
MLVTTDAIVLRSRKHGETSKIVTLYSKEYGKIDVIAKGARDIKSKFGGALEAFAESRIVFYKKDKAEPGLYLLSKAEPIRSNAKLLESLEKIEAATAIAELLNRSMFDEEQNLKLFELSARLLAEMSTAEPEISGGSLLILYYIHFSRLLGFAIQIDTLAEDRYDPSRVRTVFKTRTGELSDFIISHDPDPNRFDEYLIEGVRVIPEARGALLFLMRAKVDAARQFRISEDALVNLKELFRAFFIEHLPGVTKSTLRSAGVFGKLGS